MEGMKNIEGHINELTEEDRIEYQRLKGIEDLAKALGKEVPEDVKEKLIIIQNKLKKVFDKSGNEMPKEYEKTSNTVSRPGNGIQKEYEIISNTVDITIVKKWIGKKKGAIDKSGNKILPMEYDDISCTIIGLIVKKGDKEGLFNEKGEEILPIQYDKITRAGKDIITTISEKTKKYKIDKFVK